MRVFYDTEFIENGSTIDLISIGMVTDDGREYYAVTDAWMTIESAIHHPWLRDNVVTSLPVLVSAPVTDPWDRSHPDFKHVKPRAVIASEVHGFIAETPDAELWAWYGAYDHVALAQLWGRMIDLPDGIPKWTNDLKQECARLGNPRVPEQASGHHSALADARHNAVIARFLERY